jgi:hypothetical protein
MIDGLPFPNLLVHGVELLSPVAATVLCDSGPIPFAGQWMFIVGVATDDSAQDYAHIAHRNVANNADLEMASVEFGATSQEPRRCWFTMAASERIVVRNKGAVSPNKTIHVDIYGWLT